MFQDEFNKVEITNDKQLKKVEFGKTQSAEFTSRNDNVLPEGDMNEKYVGKTIKKVADVNVDYVNKVPNHGAQTVITGTTTATSAGAAAATTAVAASTVAVVAIATVIGISVALHDYQFDFNSFIISSNELRYELTIFDKNDEKTYLEYEYYEDDPYQRSDLEEEYDPLKDAPFLLRVFDGEYDVSQPVWYHSYNYGVFENLQLDHVYNITLSENRYGGETIYSDAFRTYVNTSFNDFTITGECDLEDNFFMVSMDFVDETDTYSDFSLYLFDPEMPEEINYTFALEKQSGTQSISTLDENSNPIIDFSKEWGYQFSFVSNGETVKFKDGLVTFYDWLGRKSAFNEFVFDKTANFIENSIEIQLDYENDLGWYKDFKLAFTVIPTQGGEGGQSVPEEEYYTVVIPLQETTEPQEIILNEYEIYTRDSEFKYTYRLSCTYRDDEIVLDEETTPFVFTDNSGGISEFYGLEFSKEANFLTNTFKVRLNYKDDFGCFNSFQLHLFPNGVNAQYDFYLEKTTEEQTLTFNPEEHYGFSFDYEYTYYLTYYDDYEETRFPDEESSEEEEPFVFTDISGGVSEYRGITFTGQYQMSSGRAPVQLDYQDDFGYLSDFVLHVLGPIATPGDGPNPYFADGDDISVDDYPYVFALEKTTEVQYINLYESDIPTSAEGEYKYAVTYRYRGQDQDPVFSESNIVFDDPDAVSEVYGINISEEANFNTRTFYVELDFQDDFGYFSNFVLQVRDTEYGGWVEKELEYTTESQPVTIDEYNYDDEIYPVDIVSSTKLSYNLVYVSAETGDPATQYFYDTEPSLSFVNSLKSEFYGLETSFDFSSTEGGYEYRLPFRFDLVNDAEYFSVPELYITAVDDEENILATIQFQNETVSNDWQFGSFSSSDQNFTIEDLTNGQEYNVVVAMYEKDGYDGAEQRVIKYSEPHSFTLDQQKQIYGASMYNYIVAGNWSIDMSLIYNGYMEMFDEGEFIIQDVEGNIHTYDLPLNEFTSVSLSESKEGTLTEDELEFIFANPVTISIKYWTLKENEEGTGYEHDEQYTVNCLSNYQFYVSH